MADNGGDAQTNLTVLDYFATEAMKTMLSTLPDRKSVSSVTDFSQLTDKAYIIAHSMLESRQHYT